jgi:hypothetical protein
MCESFSAHQSIQQIFTVEALDKARKHSNVALASQVFPQKKTLFQGQADTVNALVGVRARRQQIFISGFMRLSFAQSFDK